MVVVYTKPFLLQTGIKHGYYRNHNAWSQENTAHILCTKIYLNVKYYMSENTDGQLKTAHTSRVLWHVVGDLFICWVNQRKQQSELLYIITKILHLELRHFQPFKIDLTLECVQRSLTENVFILMRYKFCKLWWCGEIMTLVDLQANGC